jgi:hypothetical protein
MAEQNSTEIVFEYPDDIVSELDNDDVELEAEEKPARESKQSAPKEDDIDLEIEDDTPPEDRGREPLPKEVVDELEQDDLTDYSDRVKQRLSQMKKVWHDERRAKEAAAREREEAVRLARAIVEENKRLKSTLSSGEQVYVHTLKSAIELELANARRDYKEAYDSGETDRIIDAQQRMNDAQLRLTQTHQYVPQHIYSENALQEQEFQLYSNQQSRPQVPELSELDRTWQAKNKWFGQNRQMTSFALGLHEDLVEEGFRPGTAEYYRRVDNTMQKRFPEHFGDATLDEDKPAQRTRPSNVVAPATRSTAPKKVKITKSAAALARKLGITPEQYAKEMTKLENR